MFLYLIFKTMSCDNDTVRECKIKCELSTGETSSSSPDNVEPTNVDSSTPSCLDMNSIDIGENTGVNDSEFMSTSSILLYCKSKILHPYLILLSFMGLRPASLDHLQASKVLKLFWQLYTFVIIIFIILGYILQYMSCFRRDRGFCYKYDERDDPDGDDNSDEINPHDEICYDNSLFSYIGPNLIQFAGYVYSIYLFRISDSEQLQHLMERVFLLSSFPPQARPFTCAKKLVRTLWFYIILSIIWTCLSTITVDLMMTNGTIVFHWIGKSSRNLKSTIKILLGVTTVTHDMIQATVIMSYCLQAQLLTVHLHFLRNRLLTRTISSLDWMREIAEFRKLLRHLNEILAPAVCLFTLVNISWACSGILWLLKMDQKDILTTPIVFVSILNEILWIIVSVVPFILAARLTTACSMTQTVGHEIIVRPFLHQDTPQEDLNSVLLYASSLQLSARLFRVPITGRYLCIVLTLSGIVIFTLGMSHYL